MENKNDYLAHYGKLGMKWGKHMSAVLKTGGSASKESAGVVRTMGKMKKSQAQDSRLARMTDDEIRKEVSRMSLEKQYSDLAQTNTKTGHDYVANIMDVAGGVLAVAASAVTIAIGIQAIRSGNGAAAVKAVKDATEG